MLTLRVRSLLLTALLACPWAATAQVPMQGGTVTGYVWTAQNAPVADATVLLRNTVSGDVAAHVTTDPAGQFMFTAMPPGRYVVELVRNMNQAPAVAVGNPFTLAAGETVATFVRMGTSQPVLMQDRSPMTVSGHIAWSQDMTADNKRMTGGIVEVGFPMRPGTWITVEGGFFQSRYPHPVFEPSHVRRVTFQVSGRIGGKDRRGVFGQVSAGFWRQYLDLEGLGASRETGKFQSDDFVMTIGPAVGLDVPVTPRWSLAALGEFQVLPQHPRGRWVNTKVTTGLTYRWSRD